jgi:predicted metal-dependent phosphoesterase TrpH
MKCDLHVHSYHSGHANHFRVLRARDCYSSPEDVYRVAKARGMDLVCLTDHDRLDGGLEFLSRHPDAADFILGEEIECRVPDAPGLKIHLGAVGMTEAIHREIQPLRANVSDVAAYLRQAGVFFSVNHLFLMFRDELPVAEYVRRMLALAPGLETHNGAADASDNRLVADIAAACARAGRAFTAAGGSDAHTLQWVATSYTETPATTREAFLADLHAGRTRVGGRHGGYDRLVAEIYGVIFSYWRGLLGLERDDLSPARRLTSGTLAALLLPFQFIPGVVAVTMKTAERRRVARYRETWRGEGASAASLVDALES